MDEDKKDKDSGQPKEPRATYRTLRRLSSPKPAQEVLKAFEKIQKLTKGKAKGKDVVTLVREERER